MITSDESMAGKKGKAGRPRRAGRALADDRITIRLTKAEHAAWKRARGHQPLGDWIREQINRIVAKQ